MVCGLWPVDIVIAVLWYCVGFSLYCSACLPSFSLAGTSGLLLRGSAWIFKWGGGRVQILTGLKTSVFSQLTWKGAIVPVLVDLCQSLKYLGSYTQEVHTAGLVEGNIDRLKGGKSYRWEPQASWFESHNRAPSRLTLQGCVAVCWRSQKIWGIRRLIPAERKFSCGVTRTSCCLMTPNTSRGAWPPSFCTQLLRYANKLSWLHLWENSGSVSFLN